MNEPPSRAVRARIRWTSGALLLAAVVIVVARPLFVVDARPIIHVRWQADLPADRREVLERKFGLHVFADEAPTWRYTIADTGRANIDALLRHPDVADTHHIDLEQRQVRADAPVADARPGPVGERWPTLGIWAADQAPRQVLLLALVFAVWSVAPGAPRRFWRWWRLRLFHAVPALTPWSFGLFRVTFGVALCWWSWGNLSSPSLIPGFPLVALIATGLFAAGVAPVLTFPITVAGAASMAAAETMAGHGAHPFGVLLLPLGCLLLAPWREAPTLLALCAGRGRADPPDRRYGFPSWALGLGLGVAFAAAAWAKLDGGGAWVTTGSVRYAWVADGEHALVDWGLRLATVPSASVALSAAAVAIEALVLVGVLTWSNGLRMTVAIAAAGLLAGFYLLQGLFWPAWWILLLGLVPWSWFNRSPQAVGTARIHSARQPWKALPSLHLAIVTGLMVQQVGASVLGQEWRPLLSAYDMYSAVHPSPAEFDRTNPDLRYRIVAEDADGSQTEITTCLTPDAWLELTKARGTVQTHAEALAGCVAGERPPARFLVLEDWRAFDWTTGSYSWRHQGKVLATIPLGT